LRSLLPQTGGEKKKFFFSSEQRGGGRAEGDREGVRLQGRERK